LARKEEIGEARRPWPSTARALIAARALSSVRPINISLPCWTTYCLLLAFDRFRFAPPSCNRTDQFFFRRRARHDPPQAFAGSLFE
jgi:hypothetical protein